MEESNILFLTAVVTTIGGVITAIISAISSAKKKDLEKLEEQVERQEKRQELQEKRIAQLEHDLELWQRYAAMLRKQVIDADQIPVEFPED